MCQCLEMSGCVNRAQFAKHKELQLQRDCGKAEVNMLLLFFSDFTIVCSLHITVKFSRFFDFPLVSNFRFVVFSSRSIPRTWTCRRQGTHKYPPFLFQPQVQDTSSRRVSPPRGSRSWDSPFLTAVLIGADSWGQRLLHTRIFHAKVFLSMFSDVHPFGHRCAHSLFARKELCT